jgi:hypothetical protein
MVLVQQLVSFGGLAIPFMLLVPRMALNLDLLLRITLLLLIESDWRNTRSKSCFLKGVGQKQPCFQLLPCELNLSGAIGRNAHNAMPEQKSSDADQPKSRQPQPAPPLTDAAQETSNPATTNCETADGQHQTISRKIKWWRSIRNASPIVTAFATVGILVATGIYAIFAYKQWCTMHDQFVATQRAAIYLGLPDGSTVELAQTGIFTLHFRNYGPIPAENVLIEVWPAVVPYNHPQPLYERRLEIPAFQGFDPTRAHWVGFPVPPGFPFTIRKTIDSNDWQMVKSGSAQLQVLIRVSYMNQFGNNCHALNVTYSPRLGKFTLGPRPSKDYCGGKPQVARFWNYCIAITSKTKQPVQVWPPPSAQPTAKNDKHKQSGDNVDLSNPK